MSLVALISQCQRALDTSTLEQHPCSREACRSSSKEAFVALKCSRQNRVVCGRRDLALLSSEEAT